MRRVFAYNRENETPLGVAYLHFLVLLHKNIAAFVGINALIL